MNRLTGSSGSFSRSQISVFVSDVCSAAESCRTGRPVTQIEVAPLSGLDLARWTGWLKGSPGQDGQFLGGDYFFGVPGPTKNQTTRPTRGNNATITIQIIFLVVSAELPSI